MFAIFGLVIASEPEASSEIVFAVIFNVPSFVPEMVIAPQRMAKLSHGADEADLVNSGLEDTMISAWHQVRDSWTHHDRKTDIRTAAFISAINKVAVSYQDLGIFP